MVQGERLLGRFTVGERIGGGGHGTVHRAWDERLCRWVAVKSVEGQPADRILREAHAAARLNHPGIVTLYELGHQNGCAYLVSELVDGSNLRELARRGELSDRDVAELGAEICAALAHAHAAGVIHRDLKPDNVLVRHRHDTGRFSRGQGERALLADFGIATVADSPTLTQTGQVVGTLSYMSPEQAMGEGAGEPSDVYSLALTLYELWAGFNPVSRATPAATARAIGEPVASLGWERPELPEALCASIDACLDPEPRDRPGLGDLQEALASMRGALHPDRAVPEPADPADTASRPVAATPASLLAVPLAPILGLIGAAPASLVLAARAGRAATRAALAGLGWASALALGAWLDRDFGVPAVAQDAIAIGLIWAGAAVLLGVLLDVTRPAGAALGGLIWIAGLVTALGAADAPGGILLTPALVLAVAWAIWDRHGRVELGIRSLIAGAFGPRGSAAATPATVRQPRNPAAGPLADERIRATRRADRHVRAALHGAGSRAGLP